MLIYIVEKFDEQGREHGFIYGGYNPVKDFDATDEKQLALDYIKKQKRSSDYRILEKELKFSASKPPNSPCPICSIEGKRVRHITKRELGYGTVTSSSGLLNSYLTVQWENGKRSAFHKDWLEVDYFEKN